MSELMQKKIELDPTGQFVTLVLPVDEARMLREMLNHLCLDSLYDAMADLKVGLAYDLDHTLPLR